MEKDLGQIFSELKEDVSAYAELKFELLKLTTYEKAGKLAGLLSYGVMLLFLAFLATLFLFFALGILLGELLHSMSGGFAIVGGIYLIAIGVVVLLKKRFTAKIMNIVIDALDGDDDENQNGVIYGKNTNPNREADL